MRKTRALLVVILAFLLLLCLVLSHFSDEMQKARRKLGTSARQQEQSPPPGIGALARNLTMLTSRHRILFVSWVGHEEFSRVAAAEATWLSELPQNVKVVFFTTPTDLALAEGPPPFHSTLISLPRAKKSYPPQNIMFEAFRYIGEHFLGTFDFLVRVDSDVYVNLEKLVALLNTVDPKGLHYIGAPGRGRGEAAKKIKLPQDFCLGGSGVILSHPVVARMVANLKTCIISVLLPNEDTELARCVWLSAEASCQLAGYTAPTLRQMFYNIYLSVPKQIGRLTAGIPERLPSVALDAIIVHPLRTWEEFERVHVGVRRGLRPLLDTVAPYSNEKAIYRTACTHNIAAQAMLMCARNTSLTPAGCPWLRMRRCTPSPTAHFDLGLLARHWQQYTRIYVYGDEGPSSLPNGAPAAAAAAAAHGLGNRGGTQNHPSCVANAMITHGGIKSTIVAPPLPGAALATESQALRAIFVDALTRKQPLVMVVHTEAQPSTTIAADIQQQLTHGVCGGHLLTPHGGALLLSPPTKDLSPFARVIIGEKEGQGLTQQEKLCHDAPLDEATFVAALFHLHTLPTLLRAIDERESVLVAPSTLSATLTAALIREGFPVQYATVAPFTHPHAAPLHLDSSLQRTYTPSCQRTTTTKKRKKRAYGEEDVSPTQNDKPGALF